LRTGFKKHLEIIFSFKRNRESQQLFVMSTQNVLIVEDDRETRTLIAKYLRANGCNPIAVADGKEMARVMAVCRIDLLILDLMLPGEDGLSLCRKVRAGSSSLPIIMLTARGDDVDRIVGLDNGADDYLPKPFNPRELLARIHAIMRRRAFSHQVRSTENAAVLAFLGWQVDLRLREVRSPDAASIVMTGAEFNLLQAFCERAGRVLSRDNLMDLTQSRDGSGVGRSIDVLVSRIRRKIEVDPQNPSIIKTVRAGGYMFTPRVEVVAHSAVS
jgi:two-component system, OmpR family, response regulator